MYVDDVDATVRPRAPERADRGEPADQPWGERIAYIADPDGNLVMLCAPRQRSGKVSSSRVGEATAMTLIKTAQLLALALVAVASVALGAASERRL